MFTSIKNYVRTIVFYYLCGYLVYSRETLMLNADLTITYVEDIN